MKKIILLLFISVFFIFGLGQSFAAETTSLLDNNQEELEMTGNILAKQYSIIGESVLFSAEIKNSFLDEQYLEFSWYFANGQSGSGAEFSHVFSEVGEYKIKLVVKDNENNFLLEKEHEIKVGKEIVLLLSDNSYSLEEIDNLSKSLEDQGNLVFHISYQNSKELFIENLLIDSPAMDSQSFILLSDDLKFYNTFLNILEKDDVYEALKNKAFLLVNNDSEIASLAEGFRNLIEAPYIIILEDSAAIVQIYKNGSENLLNNLYQENAKYQLIGVNDEIPWYRFMIKAINEMVKHGISLQDIWIILSLSLIATIVVISRQVIGLKTIGIYTPTLLAISLLMTGLAVGAIYFVVIFLVSILVRMLTRRIKIFYMPKLALLIITVSLTIFAMMSFAAYGNYMALINHSILPIVIMVMLSEKFLSIHFEFNKKQAWYVSFETILLSVLAYFIVSWQVLRLFILAYPELILLTIPLNFLLGKWTGLRLLEYNRFSQVIHKEMDEDFTSLIKK